MPFCNPSLFAQSIVVPPRGFEGIQTIRGDGAVYIAKGVEELEPNSNVVHNVIRCKHLKKQFIHNFVGHIVRFANMQTKSQHFITSLFYEYVSFRPFGTQEFFLQ